MNLILLLVLVVEVCIGVAAWLSPQWLRSVAAHLLTRADILDLVRTEERRRLQFWSAEFGLEARSREETVDNDPRMRVVARH